MRQDKAFLASANSEYLINYAPKLNPQDHALKYGIILNSAAKVFALDCMTIRTNNSSDEREGILFMLPLEQAMSATRLRI